MIKRLLVVFMILALGGLGAANMFGVNPLAFLQINQDRPALLKSITTVSQHHGAIGNFEVILDEKDSNAEWLPTFFVGRRTLFVAAGSVNAYVDLSGLTENDLTVSQDGKLVTVRLPEAQLDKPKLDLERSYAFSEERGVFDRLADTVQAPQQAPIYKAAEEKITAAAEESELRTRAYESTKAMLSGMLKSLGYEAKFETGQ
ncbi:hypothetical protein BIU82_14160 [Arthrobacter sp. SW1]|uniref:DUF4230 domain-containing protein n=1 Tax=Arthrobacter sp. SW1 TaxID=1920889 RepID=UPI000877C606|nr:DUF4230 domain-containing protein [Arthrobacter sp. SW1]OFI39466.1 hypothetical protein BIU82_14160 [Arthrobacter sp. SW1]